MNFSTFGSGANPAIVMLSGSFCTGATMKHLYENLLDEFFVIVPEYNGHFLGSTFTTRKNEAKEAADFVIKRGIQSVKMVYGQSMGAEVAIELIRQLRARGVKVENGFFDGAPCIKLPKPYKMLMNFKFHALIRLAGKKSVDELLNLKFLKTISRGSPEILRPVVESVASLSFITEETIRNETECCYTFDFPRFDDETQRNFYFFYAKDEKAYKTCIKGVKKAYPLANFKAVEGYGHLTYSLKNPEEYTRMLKKICGGKKEESADCKNLSRKEQKLICTLCSVLDLAQEFWVPQGAESFFTRN